MGWIIVTIILTIITTILCFALFNLLKKNEILEDFIANKVKLSKTATKGLNK